MRDIKFRAWDKKYGMMDSDFYIHSSGSQYDLAARNYNTPHIEIEKTYLELMQYTGLKDKNGVEIYEGDVLSGWIGSHWHSGEDKFEEVVKYDTQTASYNFPSVEVRYGDLRVIGNIYENPELLETKKSS